MPIAAAKLAPKESGARDSLFASVGKRRLVASLSLALATLAVYRPIEKNAFINFDDNSYITRNPQIASGLNWATFKWAFTSYDAANWHPLTWLSHALDYQLFGLHAAGHHMVSVLVHALNAVILFLLLDAFTGLRWRSLAVAALFALHPLNVESVAWAAERKNLLSMLFFLLALWAYLGYARKPARAKYLAVVVLFALALMAKPQVVSFPFLLLLLDYWPLKRMRFGGTSETCSGRSLVWLLGEKLPLFVLSALSSAITLKAQHAGHAVRTVVEYSLVSRVENAIVAYGSYLKDVFLPFHLAPMYPYPPFLAISKVLGAASLLAAISVVTLREQRRPYLAVGWLWFLGTLVPMIGLVQVGMQARADRYTYLPQIGLFLALVWGIAELVRRYRVRSPWAAGLAISALAALSAITYHQIGHWLNSETLWRYTLSVTDRNFMAEDNLAQELARQGRTEEAQIHFQNTLSLYHWGARDLIAYGVYEQGHGYARDAIKQYQRAFDETSDSHLRSVALSNRGSAYLELGDKVPAREDFESALRLDPANVPALVGQGVIAHKEHDLNRAILEYTKAIHLAPSDLEYALLGRALDDAGRTQDAQTAYAEAKRLNPDLERTLENVHHLLGQ